MAVRQAYNPMSDTMKNNVEMILNNNYSSLESNESGIILTERPVTNQYAVTVEFHGIKENDKTPFLIEPLEINKLIIDQKFIDNYMDNISLIVTLTTVQVLALMDNYRNLKAHIILREADKERDYINMNEPKYEKDYLVLFKDKEIRKRINKEMLVPSNGMLETIDQKGQLFTNIEMQLIEEVPYKLRKTNMNFELRDATVKDMMLWIANSVGIKKISMPEPDNKTVYKNVVFPPVMTFEEAMQYTHNYYGVYSKGFQFYYTDDILYIYPTYETDVESPESIHMYYIGNETYGGLKCYHAYADKITHIVLNKQVNVVDLVDSGVENIGNDFILQHAERIIDNYFRINDADTDIKKLRTGMGEINIHDSNLSRHTFDDQNSNNYGMMDDVYTNRFFFDENNIYRHKQMLYAYKRCLYGTKWDAAVPFTFKPGWRVEYHYDGEDTDRRDQEKEIANSLEYKTKPGICEEATYILSRIAKIQTNYVFNCEAKLRFSIEHEDSKYLKMDGVDSTSVNNLNSSSGGSGSGSGSGAGGGSGGDGEAYESVNSAYSYKDMVFTNTNDLFREQILDGLRNGKQITCPKMMYKYFPECMGSPDEILKQYGSSGLSASKEAKTRYKEQLAKQKEEEAAYEKELAEEEKSMGLF